MYIYSIKSHSKIAHTITCHHIRNTDIAFLRGFDDKQEAISNGFRLCLHCTRADKLYNKYKRRAKDFCELHGMKCSMQNDIVSITTPMSSWKLILPDIFDEFSLYHKNSVYSTFRNTPPKGSSDTEGYHYQKFHSPSVMAILEYILNHDKFRKETPYFPKLYTADTSSMKSKKKKAKAKKKEKRIRRKQQINIVYNLFNALEQEHYTLQINQKSDRQAAGFSHCHYSSLQPVYSSSAS